MSVVINKIILSNDLDGYILPKNDKSEKFSDTIPESGKIGKYPPLAKITIKKIAKRKAGIE